MKSQSIEIKVAGQRIALKSSNADSEHVQKVQALVAQRIQEAENRCAPTVAPHQVILLALFDLAEEYLQAKDRVELHQRKLDERASALVSLIETELK
jgi:hypothetical protein